MLEYWKAGMLGVLRGIIPIFAVGKIYIFS
jgi:hypothetical protein